MKHRSDASAHIAGLTKEIGERCTKQLNELARVYALEKARYEKRIAELQVEIARRRTQMMNSSDLRDELVREYSLEKAYYRKLLVDLETDVARMRQQMETQETDWRRQMAEMNAALCEQHGADKRRLDWLEQVSLSDQRIEADVYLTRGENGVSFWNARTIAYNHHTVREAIDAAMNGGTE